MNINEMKNQKIWAVIGVTPDHDKFGYKIFKKLKNSGKTVYGINPKYAAIEGEKCYKSLKDLPELPTVIDFVVAPAFGRAYIVDAAELGIKNLWFQPGSHNESILKLAEEKGCDYVTACVLVEL